MKVKVTFDVNINIEEVPIHYSMPDSKMDKAHFNIAWKSSEFEIYWCLYHYLHDNSRKA